MMSTSLVDSYRLVKTNLLAQIGAYDSHLAFVAGTAVEIALLHLRTKQLQEDMWAAPEC